MGIGDKIAALAVFEAIEAIFFIVVIIFLEEVNNLSPIPISLGWIIALWGLSGVITLLKIFPATEREVNQFMNQIGG